MVAWSSAVLRDGRVIVGGVERWSRDRRRWRAILHDRRWCRAMVAWSVDVTCMMRLSREFWRCHTIFRKSANIKCHARFSRDRSECDSIIHEIASRSTRTCDCRKKIIGDVKISFKIATVTFRVLQSQQPSYLSSLIPRCASASTPLFFVFLNMRSST